ncbi:MAG: hypothetical protein IJJ23_10260 [Clostridia bacterium]|nr:hypothetical protein [Clostridia bacterium]
MASENRGFHSWLRDSWVPWLALQAIVMLIASILAALLPLLSGHRYALFKALLQWTALPALSACSAFAPCRRGLSHYLGWIIPPVAVACAPWAVIGYPLSPGIMLLSALFGMIGASAGAVKRRRERGNSDT